MVIERIAARLGRIAHGNLWKSYGLAAAVFAAALFAVALYGVSAWQRELLRSRDNFTAQAERTAADIRQQLYQFELVTRGGVALFATVQRPSAAQWNSYVDGLDIRARFPSMLGLGYADYAASPQGLSTLQRALQAEGIEGFSIRPPGIRDGYGPIVYLQPETPANRGAIGYDMFSEPVRRRAMATARDTGTPQLSGPVHLVQDERAGAVGLLLFSPVFGGQTPPRNVAERLQRMRGWVYTPFHIEKFFANQLHNRNGGMRVRLVNVTDGIERELYREPGFLAPDAPTPNQDPPAFRHSIPLDVYGQRWRADFHSGSQLSLAAQIPGLVTTILVGVLASLLLLLTMLMLVRTRSNARALAERMTDSYRRSEQRFRSAMRYSGIGKALLDEDGRIVEVNPAFAEMIGRSSGALEGSAFSDLIHDLSEDSPVATLNVGLGEGVSRAVREITGRDGDQRTVQLTFAPVPGEAGSGFARLVQIEDITERMRAEARIHALNRTLEARVAIRTRELSLANQEMEAFAYSISHDLRAPLRSIDGFSRILQNRYSHALDEDGKQYLQRVRHAAMRMNELIDALLKMSRLGRTELRRELVDMAQIAQEIVADLREHEPARQVTFETDADMTVRADPVLLRNLLQNLIGNAWKFTRDAPDARIQLRRDPGAGAHGFVIADNGAGFDPAYSNKLFRPFQRLHDQEQFEGHGVGLASVRHIVERHGGSIRAEGTIGQGARFYFTLPDNVASEE